MSRVRPTKFVHVVYRTRRFEQMVRWYETVFDAKVQYQNPALAFLTYDDEHHRFAFVNLDVVQPGGGEADRGHRRRRPRRVHVRVARRPVRELRAAEGLGIKPYWCIHHGITVSMYYGDPDGNQMEFQVDSYASNDEANAFMRGPGFSANPIGVEFDPEAWLARKKAGTRCRLSGCARCTSRCRRCAARRASEREWP
jgi:catechol-2,3-dioxygenase